jgi:hypothetical protein
MGMHNDGKFHVQCLCTIKPRSCHLLFPTVSCCNSFDVCEHTSCVLLQLRFFSIIFTQAFFALQFLGQGGGGAGGNWRSIVALGTRQLIEQFKRYFIFYSPKPPD